MSPQSASTDSTGFSRYGWAIALALCLPALVPTLLPGWFEGHDDLHLYRLVEYDLALRDGQIPPRWFPDISAGYGNPHPIYYAPLFYFVAELFHLAGLDPILSLKAAIVVFMALAALFMYAYARLYWGAAGALVAAVAYTYAPYHLLDLYVRKAFSEFTVFAFLPALLLAFHNLCVRRARWDLVAASLAMAAVSLSHTITTMLVPPLVGAYALFLTWRQPARPAPRRWDWLGGAALSTVIGYAVAGFFIVPAFLERNEINLKIFTEAYVDYHKHFVYPLQLVWWPWGFGMSLEGLKDSMSFRMGLTLIVATVLAVIGLPRLARRSDSAAAHTRFHLGLTAVAIFMMLPVSVFVWGLLPPLKFVQFPWRFLMLTTLSTAFLSGAAFVAFASPARKPGNRQREPAPASESWIAAFAVCAVFVVEAALGGTLGVHLRVPAGRVGFEEKPYNNMIDRGPGAAPESFDAAFVKSHTLHWLDHLPTDVSFMGLNQSDLDRPKVEVDQGAARISGLVARSASVRFHLEADAPARIRVNNYRFPGWTARVDGVAAPLIDVPRQRRVIFFDVPQGAHDVSVVFERTTARRLGDLMSLAGLAALSAVGLWPRRRDEA
ncbi:MAG TPA: 6-pyruvoyl-tetrahydropterin synthase-related protein [Patescibacteria group bacterium]|nr:6-pyruvoyl-tetrahydropterin synthase-related protein [Patescibacteria group bacterium]